MKPEPACRSPKAVELLCCRVRAVEAHRVRAVRPSTDVAAVARIPDEQVSSPEPQAGRCRCPCCRRPYVVFCPPPISVSAPERSGDRCRCRFRASIVVGMVSVKTPLFSSMRTRSSPARAVDGDLRDLLALEAEVRRAVVADVDLERAGVSRRASDLCRSPGCPGRQHAVDLHRHLYCGGRRDVHLPPGRSVLRRRSGLAWCPPEEAVAGGR